MTQGHALANVDPRDEFLALILGGCTPQEAAHAMDTPLNFFRRLRMDDAEFAADYEDLMDAVQAHEAQLIRGYLLCRQLGNHDYEPCEENGPFICTRCGRIQ